MDILKRIVDLRTERNWTEYQLAERSGLTQSTISSWYRKNMLPTIPSLSKICDAFGITLSQFFQEDNSENLTEKQKEILGIWNNLSTNEQETVMSMLRGLRK